MLSLWASSEHFPVPFKMTQAGALCSKFQLVFIHVTWYHHLAVLLWDIFKGRWEIYRDENSLFLSPFCCVGGIGEAPANITYVMTAKKRIVIVSAHRYGSV